MYWQQLDGGDSEVTQIVDDLGAREAGVRALQGLRHVRMTLGEALDVHFVDNTAVLRHRGGSVIAPRECRVDYGAQGRVRSVVAVVEGGVRFAMANLVAEHR